MVDQTNIFEGSEPKQDQAGVQEQGSSAFQLPDSVSELVGEGKKYSDINKALESIPHAQSHIQKLEQEMAEMKAKLEAQSSVEETLKRFTSERAQETPTSQPLDLNEVFSQFEERLSAREQQKVAQANIGEVVDTLTSHFGDKEKAEQSFINKANELGVNVQFLNDLAAKSPRAVYDLFGAKAAPKGKEAMSKTSVNSEALMSSRQPDLPKPKALGVGATTKDMVEAFKAAAATVNFGD